MNAFANTMFTFLLGWVRTFMQTLLNAFSSDKTHGFFEWLGDRWLYIALGMVLVGVLFDFLVWLFRWKPYLLWKTTLHKIRRWLRRDTVREKEFRQGYEDGVQFDSVPEPPQPARAFPPRESAQIAPPAPVYEPPEQPRQEEWTQPPVYEPFPQQPVWTSIRPENPLENLSQIRNALPVIQLKQPSVAPAENFIQPQEEQPPKQPQMLFEEEFEQRAPQQPPARHKRRSERYQHGLVGAMYAVKNKLNAPEEDESMIDGLPPAVDKEQAFHEPVYPKRNDESGGYSV